MLPAKQRFHARYATAADMAFGLIVQPKLIVFERMPQPRFQSEPFEGIGVQGRGVELKVVLAFSLRLIHRDIRVLGQRLLIEPIMRIGADADTRGDAKFVPDKGKRLCEDSQNLLCDRCGVLRIAQIRQQRPTTSCAPRRYFASQYAAVEARWLAKSLTYREYFDVFRTFNTKRLYYGSKC
jgi:hypothetical protein